MIFSEYIQMVNSDDILMIQIISWWYSDLLLMIFGWFSDIVLVMFRWSSDDVLMIFSWTLMTFIWYLDDIQMIFSWYSDDIQTIFRWYSYDSQMLLRWKWDDIQYFPLVPGIQFQVAWTRKEHKNPCEARRLVASCADTSTYGMMGPGVSQNKRSNFRLVNLTWYGELEGLVSRFNMVNIPKWWLAGIMI